MLKLLATLALVLVASTALAAIEKIALPAGDHIELVWWPKVSPPKGWHHDEGSSRYFSFNAFAPDGSTFSKADTVLYAKASFKPRLDNIKTLSAFVSSDLSNQKLDEPDILITVEAPIRTKNGVSFNVVRFEAGKTGSGPWERVAYAEDGEYFLTFAVSSHSAFGLKSSAGVFNAFLAGYRPGP